MLQSTPIANRIHISFFGCTNAGKSSLVNAVVNQDLAVVSEIKGTTTDPVSKTMELLPLGPVVIIDTPGFDDESELGEKRIEKTKCEIETLERAKRRYIRLLTDIRNGIEGPHFNVYYLHVVKGYSLGDTAKKAHYSKSGVCKILRDIMKRVDRK